MPEPLPGLVAIGEYGSRTTADAVVARLRSAGVEAMASHDPALTSAAPFLASERTVHVLVREADVEAALAVLAGEDPPAFDPDDPFGPGDADDPDDPDAWAAARRSRRTVQKSVLLIGLIMWLLGPALVVLVFNLLYR